MCTKPCRLPYVWTRYTHSPSLKELVHSVWKKCTDDYTCLYSSILGIDTREEGHMYQLMNRDKVVAQVEELLEFDDYTYQIIERLDNYLPYGFSSMDEWIDDRQVARHRPSITNLMHELRIDSRKAFVDTVRCVSLNDTFWIRPRESELTWSDVSPYCNSFDDAVAGISFDGKDTYGRQPFGISPEPATSGSFDKCWVRESDGPHLLKRGSYGYANAGFEPYSEKLCSDILDAAHIAHVLYTLRNYRGKLASDCPLFTSEDYGFVPTGRMLNGHLYTRHVLDFAARYSCEESFREMVVMDAVCVNVDRHAGNYGFMVDNETGAIQGMAPLFDQNLALIPYLMEHDNLSEYLSQQGPKIGRDFVAMARALMTPAIRSKLISLKRFEYQDPGFGYPAWKLDVANRLMHDQIAAILA